MSGECLRGTRCGVPSAQWLQAALERDLGQQEDEGGEGFACVEEVGKPRQRFGAPGSRFSLCEGHLERMTNSPGRAARQGGDDPLPQRGLEGSRGGEAQRVRRTSSEVLMKGSLERGLYLFLF